MTWPSAEDRWIFAGANPTYQWAVPEALDAATIDDHQHAYPAYDGIPLLRGFRTTACDRLTVLADPIEPGDPCRRCVDCVRIVGGRSHDAA